MANVRRPGSHDQYSTDGHGGPLLSASASGNGSADADADADADEGDGDGADDGGLPSTT
ncbi:hypothetical protein AB0K00_14220 [Dactylosporangium sp. NPDC049525]|uniref:hypothetical protein n=1 Tax=Dactylosporangium sp. NPDC049525 TaxID=3154730 RepID=UPI00342B8FBB